MMRWNNDLTKKYGLRIIIGIVILILAAASLVVVYNKAKQKKTAGTTEQTPPVSVQTPMIRFTAKTFAPINGWSGGKPVQYYDFSQSSENIGNVYVLITGFDANGNPSKVKDQNDIYDAKRSDSDYTDFWRVLYVTVPANYEANSVKSSSDIEKNNWPIKDSGKVENRPQILQDDKIEPDRAKSGGWAKGEAVYTWTFETDVARNTSDATKVLTGTEYMLITGYDTSGNPNQVSGQYNITDTVPGQNGYSPARKLIYVEVPANYTANSLKSSDDIKNSKYSTKDSGIVVNNPIYAVDGKVVLPGTAPQTPQMAQVTAPSQSKTAAGTTKQTTKKSNVVSKQVATALPQTSQVQSTSARASQIQQTTTQASRVSQTTTQTIAQQITANPIVCAGVCPIVAAQNIVIPATRFDISINSSSFDLNSLIIPIVSSVTWTNNDRVPHTVTFDNIDVDSGLIMPGESYTLLFLDPGYFSYHCSLHPEMVGNITVR